MLQKTQKTKKGARLRMSTEKIRKGLGQNGLQLERNIKSDRKRFCKSIRNRKKKKKEVPVCYLTGKENK